MKKRTMLLVIAFLLVFTVGTACNRKQERPAPQEKKEKIPQALTKIQDNVQKVMEEVEKIEEEIKKPVEPTKTAQGQEQGGGQQGGGQQGGGQQGGGQQQAKDPKAVKEEKISKMWDGLDKNAEQMHKSWNDYEATAIQDGAGDTKITGLEGALNEMTLAIQAKDIMGTLEKTNQVNLNLADFLNMYKGNPDGEVVKMRYLIQQSYIDARKGDWEAAKIQITEGESTLERLEGKAKLDEKDQGLMEKLKLSVEDMGEVIADRDVELLKIKRDIALQNLDAVKEKA